MKNKFKKIVIGVLILIFVLPTFVIFLGIASPKCGSFGWGCNEYNPNLVNVKISDLTDGDLEGYCFGGLNRPVIDIHSVIRWSDTVAICKFTVDIVPEYESLVDNTIDLEQAYNILAKVERKEIITKDKMLSTALKMNQVCRQKHSINVSYNPSGLGRIFVGDGGWACYQTRRPNGTWGLFW